MTMTWTRGRLLSTCSLNGKNVEFTYDGDGRRVKKLCSSGDDITEHNYTYDGSRIVADDFSSFVNYNQVVYKLQYFYNQQGVAGFRLNNDYYFFRKNLFGDIIAIYNSYGARVAKYAYDAYGVCKVMSSGGAENTDKDFIGNINPFRYRGYYYDVETKLYYLQTRYYDPSVGRFINADSLEYLDPETVGGLNLYAYCNCNPVMYVDPEGTLFGFIFWGMLIGALVLGTVGAICEGTEAYNNGARGWDVVEAAAEGFFEGAKAGAAIGSTIATIIYAAPAIAAFLSTTFTFGGMALITGGTTVMVTVTGAELVAIGAVAIAGIGLVFSRIGKSGGYTIDHHYPNDHDPTHVHINGDDGKTKVDINGNPLPGCRPMTHGEKKAFEKLFEKIIEALTQFMK